MAAQILGTTAHREQSMPIRLQCEDCGAKIKVPEGAEGRKIKCPKCGAILRAPGPDVSDNVDETVQTGDETSLDSLAAAAGSESFDDPGTSDISDTPYDSDAHEEQEFAEPSPPDLDQLAEHQGQDSEHEDEHAAGEDPLAALAAMSDDEEEPAGEQAFDGSEPVEEGHPLNELFEEPDGEGGGSESEEPAAEPMAASTKPGIPVAKPRPLPTPQPDAKPITSSGRKRRVGPVPKPQPVQSDEPKAIPLSSQPASSRAQGVPIPMSTAGGAEPLPRLGGSQPGLFLLMAGWLLRVMGFLAVGGSAKLMLVAWDLKWSIGVCLLVLLAGLLASAVAWGLGEIALALRHLLIRRR